MHVPRGDNLDTLPTVMYDSNPPRYTEPIYHPQFCFSDDKATFQVEDTRFRVHEHFLFTYSSVFRDIFRQQPSSSNIGDSDNERAKKENVIYLDGVSVLEFDSLLTFFYESWREGFLMPIEQWVALLAITHRFKFTEVESRARREVFEGTGSLVLDPVNQVALAEKYTVPISPALETLVRRPEPLQDKEAVDLSSEMVARIGVAREKYMRASSRMFASETWLKRVAHDTVRSVWSTKRQLEVRLAEVCTGSRAC